MASERRALVLVDDLSKSVYKNKQIDLILLDFSKAFNSQQRETRYQTT